MDKKATKESWINIPINIPKIVNILEIAPDLKLSFSEGQYLKLHNGLIPEQKGGYVYVRARAVR